MDILYKNLVVDDINDIYDPDSKSVVLRILKERIEGKCYDNKYIKKINHIVNVSLRYIDTYQNSHIIKYSKVIFNADIGDYKKFDILVGCKVLDNKERGEIVHTVKDGLTISAPFNNIVDKLMKGQKINIRIDRISYFLYRMPVIKGSLIMHIIKKPSFFYIDNDFSEYFPIIEELDLKLKEQSNLNFMRQKIYPFSDNKYAAESIFTIKGYVCFNPLLDPYDMTVTPANENVLCRDDVGYIMREFINYRKLLLEMCETYSEDDKLLWSYYDKSKKSAESKIDQIHELIDSQL